MKRLLFLLVGMCYFSWYVPLIVSISPDPKTGCSEDPYYAQAIIVQDWYAAHPGSAPNYAQGYSHALLDAAYVSLFEQGLVPPVPPACIVTARVSTPIYDYVGGKPIGELAAGSTGALYGRNSDSTQWCLLIDGVGWGWVSAQDVVLQAGTELDRIPLR